MITSAIAAPLTFIPVTHISTNRRLSRVEINLLKHLARFAPIGFPITVPKKFIPAFAPLWRMGFIEIWYRQDRDSVGGRRAQFVSITVDGRWRIDAIVANQPSFESRRLAGSQGRSSTHEQPSEPQQGQSR